LILKTKGLAESILKTKSLAAYKSFAWFLLQLETPQKAKAQPGLRLPGFFSILLSLAGSEKSTSFGS
jgi:hypothetical protein